MKIYDIISETQVQEGPAIDLLKLAGRGIASGAKWIAQTGSRRDLVDIMSKNSQIIRDTLRGTAPTAAQVEAIYGPRAGQMFANDPNFMAKVLKKFHADRAIKKSPPPPPPSKNSPLDPNAPPVDPNAPGAFTKIRKSLTPKITLVGSTSKLVSLYGLTSMVQDYNAGIDYANEQLKKGPPDGWTQAQYDASVKHLKATLVFQIAASTVVFSSLKHLSGWSTLGVGLRSSRWPMFQTIGNRMGQLSSAARASLIMVLQTKEARQIWSEFISGVLLDNIGKEIFDQVSKLLDMAQEKASEYSGGVIKKPGSNRDTGTKPDTSAQTDKNATSSTSSNNTSTSSSNNTATSGSTYKGDPMFQNIR